MESLFFNITDSRYKVTTLCHKEHASVERVDISNGLLFFSGTIEKGDYTIPIEQLDRMVMIVMAERGGVEVYDEIANRRFSVAQGERAIFVTSRQRLRIVSHQAQMFVLCIADFFLRRYLSGKHREPIDLLYAKIQAEVSLEQVSLLPVDALSLYIVEKLRYVQAKEQMQSIRAEHRVMEFLIHCFSLMEPEAPQSSAEDEQLATKAREILLAEFVSPPTIEVLAHRCATNASKLKKVFKARYGTTIYHYIQKLRLEEANLLLRSEALSIGQIANRVGYRHQGHFSKLFYEAYGVYPRALQQR